MRIAIIGSTGRTGRHLVEPALAEGYEVTAVARNPATFSQKHANLSVVKGDVFDLASLKQALKGSDVVILAISPSNPRQALKPITFFSDAARNVVSVMEQIEARSLMMISSAGVDESAAQPWYIKYILKPLMLKNVYQDMGRAEQIVRQSELAWTVIRPSNITDGALTKQYRVSGNGGLPYTAVSRANLAHFIIEEVRQQDYVNAVATVSA